MHPRTRTVAVFATPHCERSSRGREAIQRVSAEGVESSGACQLPQNRRSCSRLTARLSIRPADHFGCFHRSSSPTEVRALPAEAAAPGEAHRIRVNAVNSLPRTRVVVGPWAGGTMRTCESARSPPDHRGNRAVRSARLPSGLRSPSKPAKESSTCSIEVHHGGEDKAAIGIPAVSPWSL
jgi:hypothetical protein